jgi:chromosome segregation ATPase
LQIEKENASLKSKIEQMREKLHNQQEKLDAMLREQNSEAAQMHQQQTAQTSPQTSSKVATASLATCEIAEELGGDNDDGDGEEQHEPNNAIDEPRKKQQIAEINRLSMKHIDEELSELNKTVKDFIKESVAQQQDEYEKTNGTGNNNDLGAAMKQQRINELEMELDTLNNKLKNIEACLARWIFRACDYKLDLDKMNEKKEVYEQQTVELEQTRAKLSESLIKVGILTNELEIRLIYTNSEFFLLHELFGCLFPLIIEIIFFD